MVLIEINNEIRGHKKKLRMYGLIPSLWLMNNDITNEISMIAEPIQIID